MRPVLLGCPTRDHADRFLLCHLTELGPGMLVVEVRHSCPPTILNSQRYPMTQGVSEARARRREGDERSFEPFFAPFQLGRAAGPARRPERSGNAREDRRCDWPPAGP